MRTPDVLPGARRHPALLLLVVVFAVYVSGPNVTNFDSYLAIPTAVSVVHSGDLDLDEFASDEVNSHYGLLTIEGHHYDRYPWLVALFLVPAVVVSDALHALGVGPGGDGMVEQNEMALAQLVTASLITALAAVAVYLVAFEQLREWPLPRRRIALVVGLVFAFATPAWSTSSRAVWQHGPSMLALAISLLLAIRLGRSAPGRTAALLGATLAAAYAFRPSNAVPAGFLFVWVLACYRRQALAFLGGATAVAAPWVAVNVATYGEVLPPYYSASRLRLHSDYLEAVAANIFSPARGLLVFAPIVLLVVPAVVLRVREKRFVGLDLAVAAAVVVHLFVVSAQKEGWWAGHAFGPRFFADVFPLLAYLAVPAVAALWNNFTATSRSWATTAKVALAGLALVWGVFVHAQAAYLRATNCWSTEPNNIDDHPERVWSLQEPQFLAGYRALAERGITEAVRGGCPPPAQAAPGTRSSGER